MNLAGEPLSLALAEAIYRIATIEKLYNLYGPTEGTTYSTYQRVLPLTETAPAIGVPIANTQVYVVDGQLQPVPVGVAGELYIGGAGLARGYLNRPGLTAERFVPDPFARPARVTAVPDRRPGALAGRRQPGVPGAAGPAGEDPRLPHRAGRGRGGAAATPGGAAGRGAAARGRSGRQAPGGLPGRPRPTPPRRRRTCVRFLQGKLPEYMVPAAFVVLEALPLTPNGKLDRRALPAPDRQPAAQGYLAPRTAAEEALADIWAEVLGLERVGVQDNFFELGGDSILAIQVVARASRSGLRLSPRLLFQHQTVAELAQAASLAAPGAGRAGTRHRRRAL